MVVKAHRFKVRNIVLLMTAILSGCATNPQTGRIELAPQIQSGLASAKESIKSIYDNPDPCSNNSRNIGMTVGAIAGALLGHAIEKDAKSTVIGAGAGLLIGGLIGHSMDVRRCELSKIAKNYDLKMASKNITSENLASAGTEQESAGTTQSPSTTASRQSSSRNEAVGMNVMVKEDGAQFYPGTSNMTPNARAAFTQISKLYTPEAIARDESNQHINTEALTAAKDRKVLIVGHADEDINPQEAAELSEKRAETVAKVFAANGVNPDNIFFQGAGDALPVASNATEEGRADNRRIQIVDVPSKTDLKKYLQLRAPDPRHFKVASTTPPQTAPAKPVEAKPSKPTTTVSRTQTSVPKHEKQVTVAEHEDNYDFGGTLYTSHKSVSLGASIDTSMFSFISEAKASDDVIIGPCLNDRPHVSGSVKNLTTGKNLNSKYAIRDAVPGLHGAPITGLVNGNFILIVKPYAPRDAGSPAPDPKLEVFRDYSTRHTKEPDFKGYVPVNVYRGRQATLYRMFVNGPMQCMDIVVHGRTASTNGQIYYSRDSQEYFAEGPLKVTSVNFQ